MEFSVQNSIKWALHLLEGRFLYKHITCRTPELWTLKSSAFQEAWEHCCTAILIWVGSFKAMGMNTEKNSYSVMTDLEYDYRAFVWQRARKNVPLAICKSCLWSKTPLLWRERHQGKSEQSKPLGIYSTIVCAGHGAGQRIWAGVTHT